MEQVFDTQLVLARKARALRQGHADFLMARAAEELGDRLATVERRFEKAATLFDFTGHARVALAQSGKVGEIAQVGPDLAGGWAGRADEAETVPLAPGSIQLAVSLLSLHEANDVPGLLVQIRRALAPDGLFLGALAGAGTLGELRESLLAAEIELTGGATPRVAPFIDVRDAGGLLQRAGFALPVTDLETVTVRYPHMFALMADLRAMGATNALVARSRKPATRRLFHRAAEIYAERFADPDGRIRATFAFIWLSGWVPHESQQKPLPPGSGKVSLAEVLKPRDGGD